MGDIEKSGRGLPENLQLELDEKVESYRQLAAQMLTEGSTYSRRFSVGENRFEIEIMLVKDLGEESEPVTLPDGSDAMQVERHCVMEHLLMSL